MFMLIVLIMIVMLKVWMMCSVIQLLAQDMYYSIVRMTMTHTSILNNLTMIPLLFLRMTGMT